MKSLRAMFGYLWRFINGIRRVIVNLVFFSVLAAVLIFLFHDEEPIVVPDNAILEVNPVGTLVEELTYKDPLAQFFDRAFHQQDDRPEVLVTDLVKSIENATNDERIGAIHLDLSALFPSGINKLKLVGQALQKFREAGKLVIASGDFYNQQQYYLASYADKVYLNPMGSVELNGFNYTQLYFKDLLDKLKINPHIFKAGKYKSAVEPFIRNNMSDEAREANQALYGEMWQSFVADIEANRDISPMITSGSLSDYETAFTEANADTAKMALNTGLVDALLTRSELRAELINLSGYDEDEESYRKIGFQQYLHAPSVEQILPDKDKPQIAVVVARGQIVNGSMKPGMIGGDSTAALLRKARLDENTKAVVLRIDSPGGSSFASEIIRQEVLELKKAGIPVIASMSSVAASGGYWIAASADQIWAAPTTITGSIGVFGMFFTVEDSLNAIGVHADTVQTTDMQPITNVTALPEQQQAILQRSVENAYQKFLNIVADGRGMSVEAVDDIAQGRVWTGRQALERGLVDHLGDYDDAIQAAAKLAELDDYRVKTIKQDVSTRFKWMMELSSVASTLLPDAGQANANNWLVQQAQQLFDSAAPLGHFNDPQGVYSYCALCLQPR